MSSDWLIATDIMRYISTHRSPSDQLLDELRSETESLFADDANMLITQEQGLLLQLLTRATGAEIAVEIGTFTGYSAACVATALTAGGQLYCFDNNPTWTSVARKYWDRMKLHDIITLNEGDAIDLLPLLTAHRPIDLVFLDADKMNYLNYYEMLISRVRTGGLIIADNALQKGGVLSENHPDEDVGAIRQFNSAVAGDRRVDSMILPLGDGMMLAVKR